VHCARGVGGQPRQHRIAGRAHIPHVDAVDAAHARPVRGRVRHPVHRLRHRAHQHLGHGVRHGARGQRDAGADGHTGRRRPRTSRQQLSWRRRRRPSPPDVHGPYHNRRPRPMRKTPPNAHHVSILLSSRRRIITTQEAEVSYMTLAPPNVKILKIYILTIDMLHLYRFVITKSKLQGGRTGLGSNLTIKDPHKLYNNCLDVFGIEIP